MNTKTTRILWILAIGLFAFIYFQERTWDDSETASSRAGLLFPNFDGRGVTALEVTRSNLMIRVERTTNGWHMKLPVDYPAQPTVIENFLKLLGGLNRHTYLSAQELTRSTDQLAAYGLQPPATSLLLERNDERSELWVGARTVVGDRVYVRRAGEEGVVVTDGTLTDWMPPTPDLWRDRSLVHLKSISFDRLTIRQPELLPFEFQSAGGTRVWKIVSPMNVRANQALIENLLHELQQVRVDGFVADGSAVDQDQFGLQSPDLIVALGRGTNDLFTLRFGQSVPDDPARVFVQRTPPNNVVVVPREVETVLGMPFTHFRDPKLIRVARESTDILRIEAAESVVVRRQSNGQWRITEPVVMPADGELIDRLFAEINALEIVEFVKDVVTDFSDYGLEPPRRRYRFESLSGSPIADSLAATNASVARIDFGRQELDKVFVRRADETSVYATLTGDSLRLPEAAFELRDRSLWRFSADETVSVTIQLGEQSQSFERNSAGRWTLGSASQGIVEIAALEELLHRIGQSRAIAWVAQGDTVLNQFGISDLNHRLSIGIRRAGELESIELRFGRLSPRYNAYAATQLNDNWVVFEFSASLYQDILRILATPADRDG